MEKQDTVDEGDQGDEECRVSDPQIQMREKGNEWGRKRGKGESGTLTRKKEQELEDGRQGNEETV